MRTLSGSGTYEWKWEMIWEVVLATRSRSMGHAIALALLFLCVFRDIQR